MAGEILDRGKDGSSKLITRSFPARNLSAIATIAASPAWMATPTWGILSDGRDARNERRRRANGGVFVGPGNARQPDLERERWHLATNLPLPQAGIGRL
jgi:hypothetical protein